MIYSPTTEDRERYRDMNVLILSPCGSYHMPSLFVNSLVNMVAHSCMNGLSVSFGISQRMVVHWARNELARLALDMKSSRTGKRYTHILWLDDDHVFEHDLLTYLARAETKDLDMVSALYYGRDKPLPVVYVRGSKKNDEKYKHYPLMWPPTMLCEVDAVGFGALLMKMDVLDGMEFPWFKFDDCGEDIYFCVRAKEHGFKVWLDPTYVLGHIGEPNIIGKAEFDKHMAENEAEYGERKRIPLGGS